jgi:SEC-C motif-containing protein
MARTSESPEFPAADARCPCTSGLAFGECCGRWLVGTDAAPTASQLMRSRFTAFAVGDPAYLISTWHPSTRPSELELELDPSIRWQRLDVERAEAGGPFDREGVVEFTAHYRHDGERGEQHEVSTFRREGGRWFYVGAAD